MPVPIMTWRPSALYTVAQSLAGYLAGLKAAVDAEVAANPTTALWQVADFSASNGTLTLKNTQAGIAAGGAATRRLMLFGGSLPHGAAIDGATAMSTTLYCGVAPSGGVDVPPQGYAAGAPYTTGPWISGGAFVPSGTFGANLVQYYETFAGMVIAYRLTAMTGGSGNIATAFLGALAVTLDGEAARDMATGSVGTWTTNQDSNANLANEWMPTGDPANSTSYARASYPDPPTATSACSGHSSPMVQAARLFEAAPPSVISSPISCVMSAMLTVASSCGRSHSGCVMLTMPRYQMRQGCRPESSAHVRMFRKTGRLTNFRV